MLQKEIAWFLQYTVACQKMNWRPDFYKAQMHGTFFIKKEIRTRLDINLALHLSPVFSTQRLYLGRLPRNIWQPILAFLSIQESDATHN